MILHQAQNEIAKDNHRFRVVNCGRQFGKTTLSIEEIKGIALSKNANIVYIAPTIQQARDIAWNMLKAELRPITVKVKEAPSLEMEVTNMVGGTSIIKLRGWEAVETLRGQQFDFIILDEVASMRNFWLNWQEVLIPTLTFRKGGCMFISTPKGFNHFYDLYNFESKDVDFKSFHFTSYDNPHLDKAELEKTKIKSTEDRFAQEYMADFRKQTGLVYKEFSREKHLFDDLLDRGTVVSTIQGIDWGYRHNAVVLDIEKTANGHYWVVDEWSYSGKTDEETINYASSKKANKVYADPESPQAIEKAKKAGMNIYDVVKGKNSVNSGIDTVQEMFKQGTLHVHKKCLKLITSLEVYAFEENSDRTTEEGKDECDALRYPLMMDDKNVYEEIGEEFNMYSSSFA